MDSPRSKTEKVNVTATCSQCQERPQGLVPVPETTALGAYVRSCACVFLCVCLGKWGKIRFIIRQKLIIFI